MNKTGATKVMEAINLETGEYSALVKKLILVQIK
jgi:hypothetical protein